MHLCASNGLTKKRSFILSSCHQVLSLGGVRADDNTADEERSSEINGEGCAHLSIHSSFFKKTSIHVILDVRMAREKKYCSQAGQAFTGQVLSERHEHLKKLLTCVKCTRDCSYLASQLCLLCDQEK